MDRSTSLVRLDDTGGAAAGVGGGTRATTTNATGHNVTTLTPPNTQNTNSWLPASKWQPHTNEHHM